MRTQAEIKKILAGLLPDGSDELYSLGNSDVVGGTLWALAGALKEGITDRVDSLMLGVTPASIDESIPEWENACGLSNTPLAKFGTKEQRRNAILAVLRLSGSFSKSDIQAVIQPYFLYADPSAIVINEPDRAALRTAHTVVDATPVGPFIGMSSTLFASTDESRVSPAGAEVTVNLTSVDCSNLSFSLSGPSGFSVVLNSGILTGAAVAAERRVYFPEFAGKKIKGTWTLSIYATVATTLHRQDLFVEGIGNVYDAAIPPAKIGEGLGKELFKFSVYADPLLLGTGYDLVGAAAAIERFKPAHLFGEII